MHLGNFSVPPCSAISPAKASIKKVNSVCSISELSGCGLHQVCEQIERTSSTGICQCQNGFASQDDGVSAYYYTSCFYSVFFKNRHRK